MRSQSDSSWITCYFRITGHFSDSKEDGLAKICHKSIKPQEFAPVPCNGTLKYFFANFWVFGQFSCSLKFAINQSSSRILLLHPVIRSKTIKKFEILLLQPIFVKSEKCQKSIKLQDFASSPCNIVQKHFKLFEVLYFQPIFVLSKSCQKIN